MLFHGIMFMFTLCPLIYRQTQGLPELDLFLCMGQSNMAGIAPLEKGKGDYQPIPNVFLVVDKGQWVTAVNPLNRFSSISQWSGQMSPTFGFAQTYAAVTKRPVGLIVNAKDGSTLEACLKQSKDEEHLYKKTLKRALAAKSHGTFQAILWHQGEGNRQRVGKYPEQLKNL